jgi:hypothetical protein
VAYEYSDPVFQLGDTIEGLRALALGSQANSCWMRTPLALEAVGRTPALDHERNDDYRQPGKQLKTSSLEMISLNAKLCEPPDDFVRAKRADNA